MINISKIEQNRLAKLNLMLDELRRGKNVKNRRLATWLTKKEFESFKSAWKIQQQIRDELNDKPDELRRYENKIHQATFSDNKAEFFARQAIKINPLNFVTLVKAFARKRWRYCKR